MNQEHDPLPTAEDVQLKPRLCWSSDNEDFSAWDLGDLLDLNDDLEPGRTVYYGVAVPCSTDFVDADYVIDAIADRAYDVGGEHADGFPDVSKEAKAELDSFLSKWQAEHCKPTFYSVENVKEYTLTDADFATEVAP